jgi:hypothetical protein
LPAYGTPSPRAAEVRPPGGTGVGSNASASLCPLGRVEHRQAW